MSSFIHKILKPPPPPHLQSSDWSIVSAGTVSTTLHLRSVYISNIRHHSLSLSRYQLPLHLSIIPPSVYLFSLYLSLRLFCHFPSSLTPPLPFFLNIIAFLQLLIESLFPRPSLPLTCLPSFPCEFTYILNFHLSLFSSHSFPSFHLSHSLSPLSPDLISLLSPGETTALAVCSNICTVLYTILYDL